jgi:hypothetical protein
MRGFFLENCRPVLVGTDELVHRCRAYNTFEGNLLMNLSMNI